MSGTMTAIPPFSEIPSPWQVPQSLIEVDPSYANVGILPIPARTLIIGQITSAGTLTPGTIWPNITRPLDGSGLAGPGSVLDRMITRYLGANRTVPLDVIGVADASGATAAQWTVTFGGTWTVGGTTAIGVAGQRLYWGTLSSDTPATSATAFAAAVNATPSLPVTAAVSSAVVTLTAKNKGLCGNDILILPNPTLGDALPAGMTIAVSQTVQGATNPDISAAISAIAGMWYTDIIIPWSDATNLAEIGAEAVRRYNAMVHLDTRVHFGYNGTFSQQLTKAAAVNNKFMFGSFLNQPQSPVWEIAAVAGGAAAASLVQDPARQLDQIALPGALGPVVGNRPDDNEKELLLVGGCSVFRVARDATMSMHRYVSTYTTNALGNLDPAWHDVMEQAVWSRIRYDWRAYFRDLYPSNKLAPDNSLAAQRDPSVVTPVRAKGSWTARLMVYASNGWIINETADARAATFAVDPNDPNRLNYRLPTTRIGNMMVDAGQLAFNVS